MSITPITPDYDECMLWPVDPACLTADWNDLPPAVQARSLALASATLRRLSGYRVGNCPIVVRPCKRSCATQYGYLHHGSYGPSFTPYINIEGNWVNACGCVSDCSCGQLCEVELPGPVTEVEAIDVGGVEITDFTVYGNRVAYTGTDACPFPTCQDLSKAPGEEGTFTITYFNSYRPDALASYAAGILAMEYAKACTGSKACKLPRGTTSVVRQGVSIEIATGSFPNGMTGIHDVDAWIALWRPEGSPRWQPRVWSPDVQAPRVQH